MMLVDGPPHICTRTEEDEPTTKGLRVFCPDRHQFWYEGSHGAQGSYEDPLWVTAREGSQQVCCTACELNAGQVYIIQVLTIHCVSQSSGGLVHEG